MPVKSYHDKFEWTTARGDMAFSYLYKEKQLKIRVFTSGNWRVWGAGGILIFGGQSLLSTSWTECRAGGGAWAPAVRGSPVEGLRPRRAALTPAQELVGHGGTDGVQTAAVVERAGGSRIAASYPRLLKRVAGGWHPPKLSVIPIAVRKTYCQSCCFSRGGGGGGNGKINISLLAKKKR